MGFSKDIADLGFSAERLAELQKHVQGAGKDHGAFGYSAETEHLFRETGNPTSKGSIEADMRKVGEFLGYEHAGTLNHDRVRDFLMQGEKEETKDEPGKTFNDYEFSPQIQEAMDRAQSYRERAWSGAHAQEVYGKSNELAKGSKFYSNPGETEANGAQAASDSATTKHFDASKYETDYSENEFKHFKTQY